MNELCRLTASISLTAASISFYGCLARLLVCGHGAVLPYERYGAGSANQRTAGGILQYIELRRVAVLSAALGQWGLEDDKLERIKAYRATLLVYEPTGGPYVL